MKVLFVKIREDDAKNSLEYKNEFVFADFKKLACFFLDLKTYGGNVEKAFEEYKKLRKEEFPW